jgi:type I restriction enzyme S subunit
VELRLGYKQTEFGVIPEDWEISSLGDLAIKVGSGITPAGGQRVYREDGRPFVRSQNVGWGDLLLDDMAFIDDDTHATFPDTELQCGDVLLNITGASIGRSAVAAPSLTGGNVNQHVCIIRPAAERLDPRYLNLFLLSASGQRQVDSFQAGGNRQGLNFGQVRSIRLPHPPTVAEQRAIATALGGVDALLGGLTRLIDKKRDLKQAAMQKLLTGQTRLAGFHGEWERVRLADISAFITKGSTPTTYGFGWQSSGVLFLRSECVSPEGLDLAQSMFISAEAHHVLRRSAVQSNDLLITITGNVGRVAKLPGDFGEANINQHVARIRIIDEATCPGWVYHFLSQPGLRQHFEKITTGQAYPQISLVQVRDTFIPRPRIAEQRQISAALDEMDGEIMALEARLEKTRALKQAMMQELLTGRSRLV